MGATIQPKFPQISVQNSMDRFGPTGKVSKKTGPPFDVDLFSRSDRSDPLVEWIAPNACFILKVTYVSRNNFV